MDAVVQQDSANAASNANPIRKVVTMLQAMQKKVNTEGAKEKELYDKFACYCRNGAGELSKSISEAETKIPLIGSDTTEAVAKKQQLEADLKGHQADRAAAKAAMSMADVLREKAAAAFAKEKASYTTNLDALEKATAAISKGMSGAFLQTNEAQLLKSLVVNEGSLLDADRQDIMAFLSGGQDGQYVPQSGQIVGILKSISDLMNKGFAEAKATEYSSVTSHSQLMLAKQKELDASTKAIESKSVRVGSLAVDIATMQNDLSDTEQGLNGDKEFLRDMDKNCATQAKEWDERTQTRSAETLAIAETIRVLNDDEALEMFKKTLPGASSSFMQMAASKISTGERALSMIRKVRLTSTHRPQFDFIALAIQGKAVGFEKVIAMIDRMVATLKVEQTDDDHKQEYCGQQFEFSDEKKKSLAKTISDLDISITEATDGVSTLKEEIESLTDKIKDLDKSVGEATDQRKSEHEDFTELMASDSAAKELLKFAMNRMNKFYNPSFYLAPPKRSLSEQDQLVENMGGTVSLAQVSEHSHLLSSAPSAPSTFDAYAKKSDDSKGVMAMLQLLVKNLDKEMTEAGKAEEDAQNDYEQMLKDSAAKRTLDGKALTDKNIAKASMQADVEASKEAKAATGTELMATGQYIASLHAECDWLLQYFDIRKQARTEEIDALANAKSVLQGADLSLLQRQSHNLRKR